METEKESQKVGEKEQEVEIDSFALHKRYNLQYLPGNEPIDIAPKGGVFTETQSLANHFPCVSLKTYLDEHVEYQNYEIGKGFEDISMSLNFAETPNNDSETPYLNSYKLFKFCQKPFDYVLLDKNTVRIISHNDSKSMADPRLRKSIYSLKSKKFPFNAGRTLSNKELETVVKIKFLDGVTNYSPEEFSILSDWIKNQNSLQMQQFFENEVLKSPYISMQVYNKSMLKRFFDEININATAVSTSFKKITYNHLIPSIEFLEGLVSHLNEKIEDFSNPNAQFSIIGSYMEIRDIEDLIRRIEVEKTLLDKRSGSQVIDDEVRISLEKRLIEAKKSCNASLEELIKAIDLSEIKQQMQTIKQEMSTTKDKKKLQSLAISHRILLRLVHLGGRERDLEEDEATNLAARELGAPTVNSLISEQIGPIGIPNVGNTCYMNAVLQGILTDGIKERIKQTPDEKHPVIKPLKEFVQALDSQRRDLISKTASNLRDAFYQVGQGDLRDNIYKTQDADNILGILGVALDLEYHLVDKKTVDLANGNKHLATPYEKTLLWPPLTAGKSVQEGFSESCDPKVVQSPGYKIQDPQTKQVINADQFTQENKIQGPPPPVLVVRVGSGQHENLGAYRPYIVNLRRDAILDASKAFDQRPQKQPTYVLKGICERGANGNHWVSRIYKDNQWFLCNDGTVKQKSPDGAEAAYLIYELQPA